MLHAVLGERAVAGDIQYKLTEDDGVNTPGPCPGPDNDEDNVQCVSNSPDRDNDDSSLLCVWLVFDVPDVTPTHRLGQCFYFFLIIVLRGSNRSHDLLFHPIISFMPSLTEQRLGPRLPMLSNFYTLNRKRNNHNLCFNSVFHM